MLSRAKVDVNILLLIGNIGTSKSANHLMGLHFILYLTMIDFDSLFQEIRKALHMMMDIAVKITMSCAKKIQLDEVKLIFEL